MDRLTLRLSSDLLRRFDAAATRQGGRSRLLRKVMEAAALAPLPEVERAPPAGRTGKMTLRLSETDFAALEAEAAAMGLSRTQWTVALIRRRLHGRPQFSRSETFALIDIQRELRRIGVNLNQIARALNTAVLEGRVLDLEMDQLAAFQAEIRAHSQGLRQAFEGNLDDWAVEP